MDVMIKRWTTLEEEFIVENYPSKGYGYCVEKLGRTQASIERKAMRLGIRSEKSWSKTELETLEKYYPIEGYKKVMELTNRSRGSIQNKASDLSLKGKGFSEFRKTNEEYDNELFYKEIDICRIENYINARTPILHECFKEHQWRVKPNDILSGHGCPICATYGFKPEEPAILYFISIADAKNKYYKIDVTQVGLKDRFVSDRDKEIIQLKIEHFDKGLDAYNKEQTILKEYEQYKIHAPEFLKSGGNTELFSVDIMSL